MDDRFQNIKIVIAIIIALFFVLLGSGEIKINNIFRQAEKISSLKIDFLHPTAALIAVPTSIPTFTQVIPTRIPTKYIRPTYIFPTKKYIYPTLRPTLRPTSTPVPPTPFSRIIGALPLAEPLNQPYYGKSSGTCYTPSYFIRYYGGNLTPNNCYANVKASVEANLVKVSLLGKSVSVHKNAAPYFQAVNDELAKYKKNGTTYEFSSKTYTIKTVGTYVFRCNVNASTGDPWDTCQSGCVIGTHAFGIAVDVNEDTNCNGCGNYDMPPEIIKAFERWGFRWGGRYKELFGSKIDPMHFEFMYDMCKGL